MGYLKTCRNESVVEVNEFPTLAIFANEKTIYKKDDKNLTTVERCHGRYTFHGFPNDSFQGFMHFPLELIPAQWVCNDFKQ